MNSAESGFHETASPQTESWEGAGALPLVSIVTPTLNMARYLPEAAISVLTQDYPNIEYIVMDGGSSDGTAEILESFGNRLRYVIGQDNGAADAINRGFQLSRGSILGWLSADDRYCPGAIRRAVDALSAASEACAVYGEADWIDAAGKILGPYPTRPPGPQNLAQDCCICQPACFFRRSAFEALGGLDTSLKSAFDYDLWIRMAQKHKFARVEATLAVSRMHSTNKTLGQRGTVFQESIRVLRKHYRHVPVGWVHAYLCHRMKRKEPFPAPLPLHPVEFLLSLPLGCWYNRWTPGRYLVEWAGTFWRAASNLARRRTFAGR